MTRKTLLIGLLLFTCQFVFGTNGYSIYPIPQQQSVEKGVARFTPIVNIVCSKGIDAATRQRALQVLEEHGLKATFSRKTKKGQSTLYLGIVNDKEAADKRINALKLDKSVFQQPKYDRHILSLRQVNGQAEAVVLGEHTDAVFYGLASLEQMLDTGRDLPCVSIYDWADVKNRGIIEGYYGVPYSQKVTEDLFRFMARYKMNSYVYGAKSDPYHSQKWEAPYPTQITPDEQRIGMMTQDMLRSMVDVAHQCKVNFVWAIHPGNAFTDKNNTNVLDKIMHKFDDMYRLGVRQFGVFVDDVGVPYNAADQQLCANRLTDLQGRVDDKWNRAYKSPQDTVKPLHYVPQLYAYSWTNKDNAKSFFQSLRNTPSKTIIYITGAAVWTVPNNKDPETVSQWLGREVGWWWNYPCNDNDMDKLFVGDMSVNFHDEKHINNNARLVERLQVKTLISNPMQQGAASKIALFSIADYAWNNAAFDVKGSYKAAIPAVVGKDFEDAFQVVAPYLRHYDYSAPWPTRAQMEQLYSACLQLEKMKSSPHESQALFYADIQPWLVKVRDMALAAKILLTPESTPDDILRAKNIVKTLDDHPDYRVEVLNGMGNDIKLSTIQAHPAHIIMLPALKKLADDRK